MLGTVFNNQRKSISVIGQRNQETGKESRRPENRNGDIKDRDGSVFFYVSLRLDY